jgi:hypothetical protein
MADAENRKYVFGKEVAMSFQDAVEKTKAALAAEGFGVPVTMNLKEIFKAKIDKVRIGKPLAVARWVSGCRFIGPLRPRALY